MGMKQRAKKQARLEQLAAEKAEITKRKEAKTAPIIREVKRVVITAVATAFILYLGVLVNSRLPDILAKLTEKGA